MITETLNIPLPILCAFVRRAQKYEFDLSILGEDEDNDEIEIEVEFDRSDSNKFHRLEDMIDRYNEENGRDTEEEEQEQED